MNGALQRVINRLLQSATAAALAGMPLAAAPALADDLAALETLSRATDSAASGIAVARSQIGEGDLLGALATLERLAIQHPAAKEAQLLHASLLCRLDDASGAAREFSHLKKRDYARAVWDEANAACAVPLPVTTVPANTAPAPAEPASTAPVAAEPPATAPVPNDAPEAKPRQRRRIDGI